MMFMMPMPPTTSETAAMPARSNVIVLLAWVSVLTISSELTSSSLGMLASTKAAAVV